MPKVLIIEDDETTLQVMVRELEDEGFEAINPGITLSGVAALHAINEHPEVDWILLDMNYSRHENALERAEGVKVAEILAPDQCKKVVCNSMDPGDYFPYLWPLGVLHFGGKYKFLQCLKGECNCLLR